MYKLTPHSLTKVNWFTVLTCPMTLEEKNSALSFTIGESAPEIAPGDWLLDDQEPGAGIVWRVKSVETNYNTKIRTVSCEHIIQVLKDVSIFGEVNPEDMGGSSTIVAARRAIEYALNRSPDWRLDQFGYEDMGAGYSFNGDTVFAAVETVCSTLDDCWWVYDLSSYPFKLSIAPKSQDTGCEMRAGRNLTTIKKSVDMSRMYTRLYPIGSDNLTITGDYISKNESKYGTVMKVETDSSIEDEWTLRKWAENRLNKHCEPSVTISISGLDLSESTGESLDKITLGKRCRVPLPEFKTTILETVTKLQWKDKLQKPKEVTVTLANNLEDLATIIKTETETSSATTGKSGRTSAKKAEEDHAWFVDTTDHVGMVAEAVAGEGASRDWSRVASVMVDGNGIHQRVVQTENDIITNATNIDITERGLAAEIIDRSNADTELEGKITVTASGLKTEFSNSLKGVQSQINQEADRISLVVEGTGTNAKIRAASIVTEINKTGSGVAISASKIKLDGDITLNNVMSAGSTNVVFKKSVQFGSPVVAQVASDGSARFKSVTVGSNPYYSLGGETVGGMIRDASAEGNTLTLTKFDGTVINFSKATTLRGSWDNGRLTVTASPQGTQFTSSISVGTDGNGGDNFSILAQSSDNTTSPSGTLTTRASAYIYLKEVVNGTLSRVNATTDSAGTVVIGSKSTADTWNGGYDSAAISSDWGTGSDSNLLTLSKVSGSYLQLQFRVTASAAVAWDSSANKYKATAKALVNTIQKATDTDSSGVLTLTTDSSWVGGSVWARVKEGSTELLSMSVTLPSGSWSNSWDSSTKSYSVVYSIGGTTRSTTVSAAAAWNAGGRTAYATVTKVSSIPSGKSSSGTLDKGAIYRVLPAYVNSSGNSSTVSDNALYYETDTDDYSGYYNSSYWDNGASTGVIKIPNITATAAETWITLTPTASGLVTNWTGSRSGWYSLGSFSKSSLSQQSYIYFDVNCQGASRRYYITVN